jgi:hypothetical protein
MSHTATGRTKCTLGFYAELSEINCMITVVLNQCDHPETEVVVDCRSTVTNKKC